MMTLETTVWVLDKHSCITFCGVLYVEHQCALGGAGAEEPDASGQPFPDSGATALRQDPPRTLLRGQGPHRCHVRGRGEGH